MTALLLEFFGSTGIGVEVSALAEELSAKTILRVAEDAVLVAVMGSGGILAEHGDLPAEVATLGALSGGSLLRFLIPDLAAFLDITLNLNNVEHNAVGRAGKGTFVVEEILKGSVAEASVLLVNFRKDNSVLGNILSELSLVRIEGVLDLGADSLAELATSRDSHDVGVGSKGKNTR